MKQEEKKKSQRLEHQENAGGRGQARLDGFQWLYIATRGIRFRPDRAAVRRELEAHLEDKQADLQRIFPDLSPEEAERQAVESMGDAWEVRKQLAKIHKPWLGWLWRLSQILAVLACLWLVSFGFFRGDDAYLGDHPYSEWWDGDDLPRTARMGDDDDLRYLPGDDPNQLLALEIGQTERVAGQDVSLRRAALWQGEDGLELYLYLRINTWRFWERGVLREEWMKVTDDRGNCYALEEGNYYALVTAGDPPEDGSRASGLAWGGYGPFHSGYEVYLRDVDPEARWIRLDYGPTQPLVSFTVELKEENQ